jgi:hypothetical protein
VEETAPLLKRQSFVYGEIRMRKIKILAAGLCLLTLLAGCDSRYAAEEKFASIQKKLMPSVAELTKIPTRVEAASEPYISGKIAVFNKAKIAVMKGSAQQPDAEGKTYFMTPLYFREMEENYAAAPEEVGTVVVVNCDALSKGVYKTDDGKEFPAEVEDCELIMVDRAKEVVILKRKFEKAPSEERRAYGNSVVRQSAQEDVLQFLKGLPRK